MELVRHQRFQQRLRSSLLSSLMYPSILLLLLIAVLTLIFGTIVPMFGGLFVDFGLELPMVTVTILSISDAWQAALSVVWVIPVTAFVLRLVLGKSNWRLFLSTMPIFGPLMHWNGVAQFSRLLPIFLRHDIPLPESLRLTSAGIQDANVALATRGLAKQIEDGGTLHSSIENCHRIPQTAAVIVGWGEQQDRLSESLELWPTLVKVELSAERTGCPASFRPCC